MNMDIDENLAIFVNRKKKATTKNELEKFTKDVNPLVFLICVEHFKINSIIFVLGAHRSNNST